MKQEEIEKQARERAEKLEEKQILGVYDNEEDLARDMAWNDGKVSGYEDGFQDGAKWGIANANGWHDLRKNPSDLPKDGDRWTVCYPANPTEHTFADFQSTVEKGYRSIGKLLLITGDEVGFGSDGEPLLINVKIIKELDEDKEFIKGV